MSKVYLIAYKSYNEVGGVAYEIASARVWTDKLEASRALRAAGGGKRGDTDLVLYSLRTDDNAVSEVADAPPEQKEFYVTVSVLAPNYDEAHARLMGLLNA